MKVDIHAHYLPRESLKVAKEIGKRYKLEISQDETGRELLHRDGKRVFGPFRDEFHDLDLRWRIGKRVFGPFRDEFHDLDLRWRIMQRAGVEMQALSVQNSFLFYWMEPEAGLEFARWMNDEFAAAVKREPRRFVAMATVPMQDARKAAGELERAMKKLGLRGVQLGSNIGGRYFDDPGFDPFWEAAQALEALVFVHPTNGVGAERMKDHYLLNLIGNPAETSLAFAK
ncbi:MAG: amidohydrolase family protein, partial [Gemmatimonadetes bacterium]|nr:amidohydrolase family protein [Gemmatimonadota bacterium]